MPMDCVPQDETLSVNIAAPKQEDKNCNSLEESKIDASMQESMRSSERHSSSIGNLHDEELLSCATLRNLKPTKKTSAADD